jgi:hypothetical protein
VTDDGQIFFDTLEQTRKVENLRRNPRIAFVIGGTVDGDERTVQYEGIADEPRGLRPGESEGSLFQEIPGWSPEIGVAGLDLHQGSADVDSIQRLQSQPTGDPRVQGS